MLLPRLMTGVFGFCILFSAPNFAPGIAFAQMPKDVEVGPQPELTLEMTDLGPTTAAELGLDLASEPQPFERMQTAPAIAGIGDFGAIAGVIIGVGRLAWDLVRDGRPLANVEMNAAGALPHRADWTELEGWQGPAYQKSRILIRSGTSEAARFNYAVRYYYGGQYRGKGAYLADVAIVPLDVQVRQWGNNFGASLQVGQPINRGTAKNPIAELPIRMRVAMGGLFKNRSEAVEFSIRGDGAYTRLGARGDVLELNW